MNSINNHKIQNNKHYVNDYMKKQDYRIQQLIKTGLFFIFIGFQMISNSSKFTAYEYEQ